MTVVRAGKESVHETKTESAVACFTETCGYPSLQNNQPLSSGQMDDRASDGCGGIETDRPAGWTGILFEFDCSFFPAFWRQSADSERAVSDGTT